MTAEHALRLPASDSPVFLCGRAAADGDTFVASSSPWNLAPTCPACRTAAADTRPWNVPDPALVRMVKGTATFELRTSRERDRIARVAANQTEWEDTDQ